VAKLQKAFLHMNFGPLAKLPACRLGRRRRAESTSPNQRPEYGHEKLRT
jgi:hypothetical protein